MKTTLCILVLSCLALMSRQALCDNFQLTGLEFHGTGCSGDETHLLEDVNADGLKDTFAIIFDEDFIAEQGPSIPLNHRRKFCDIRLGTHIPQGWQFAIIDVEYEGFAQLGKNVYGTQKASYEFPLFSNEVETHTSISGPIEKNYDRIDKLGIESLVWSPCGLNVDLDIKSQVYLTGDRYPASFMTVDSVDGTIKQVFHFAWRRCDAKSEGIGVVN